VDCQIKEKKRGKKMESVGIFLFSAEFMIGLVMILLFPAKFLCVSPPSARIIESCRHSLFCHLDWKCFIYYESVFSFDGCSRSREIESELE